MKKIISMLVVVTSIIIMMMVTSCNKTDPTVCKCYNVNVKHITWEGSDGGTVYTTLVNETRQFCGTDQERTSIH
jgi:hypothetical protein